MHHHGLRVRVRILGAGVKVEHVGVLLLQLLMLHLLLNLKLLLLLLNLLLLLLVLDLLLLLKLLLHIVLMLNDLLLLHLLMVLLLLNLLLEYLMLLLLLLALYLLLLLQLVRGFRLCGVVRRVREGCPVALKGLVVRWQVLLGLTKGQLEGLQYRASSRMGRAVLLRVQRPGFQGLLEGLGLLLLPVQSPHLHCVPVRFNCGVWPQRLLVRRPARRRLML